MNNNNFSNIKHVAFIMDGNRRWAKKNTINNLLGYKKGIENLLEKANFCIENNIKYVTFFTLSVENLKREKIEIDSLFLALELLYKERKKGILEKSDKFEIKIIGNLNLLSQDKIDFLKKLEFEINENKSNQTKDFNKTIINIAIAYSSRQEIVNSFNIIIENILQENKSCEGKIERIKNLFNEECGEELIINNLQTKNIPDPDVLIRTGGEKRLSNFLLWQLSYTELFFLDTLWPDFTNEELQQTFLDFFSRKRNFGK